MCSSASFLAASPPDASYTAAAVIDDLVLRARRKRWLAVTVASLRIFVGFAFVPAGLKKVLGQPFTDPDLHGPFHDFLHAFYATGWFYRFVGVVQLLAAVLLMTGRFATVGALLALPILTTILALCWSTKVYPTASVVSLMWLGTFALLLWDWHTWRGIFGRAASDVGPDEARIDRRLWEACGAVVLCMYLAVCAATGGVYRPRGAAWSSPAFYVFPAMLLTVVVTGLVDRAKARKQT